MDRPPSAAPPALFLDILDLSPLLACAFQPDTTLTYVNESYARFFKESREALLGRKWIELVPEPARAEVLGRFETLTPAEPHITYEHEVVAPDGPHRWFRWSNQAVFDASLRLDHFVAFGEDVTEQKLLDRRLIESEKRQRDFALCSTDFEWESDPSGRITYISERCHEVIGFLPEEMTGRPCGDFVHDEDRERMVGLMRTAAESGEPMREAVFRARTSDDRVVFLSASALPIRDSNGRILA